MMHISELPEHEHSHMIADCSYMTGKMMIVMLTKKERREGKESNEKKKAQ